MANLKLSSLQDSRPVKLTAELPAQVHRDLVAYAGMLGQDGEKVIEPARLIAPMLARFMAADREFVRQRRRASRALDPAQGLESA